MLLAYTLLSRRNALVEQIYAPIRCFVPNKPSKLSNGCNEVSISTLSCYQSSSHLSIKLGSTEISLANYADEGPEVAVVCPLIRVICANPC
jgi:hypothetical protein